MKGTRTYQIALAAVALILLDFTSIEIEAVGNAAAHAAQTIEKIIALYTALLAMWKVAAPHPMRHEND